LRVLEIVRDPKRTPFRVTAEYLGTTRFQPSDDETTADIMR
jgi:hypothetical protein